MFELQVIKGEVKYCTKFQRFIDNKIYVIVASIFYAHDSRTDFNIWKVLEGVNYLKS